VRAGHAERKFIGFATGVDEVADAERCGKERSEALGVTIGVVVEIAGVGVEDGELVLDGANDARMGVADERNIIVDVEERPAGVVKEIFLPAANDFQGTGVGDAEIFAEEGAAIGEGFVERRSRRRKMAGGNAEDEIRIGREAEPDRALGGEGNTGKIGGTIEKVENDLKMKMRRPAAVFASVADMSEDFAAGNALAHFERRERCGGEMAVESEEVDTRCRGVMKDDDGAVIEKRGVIRERLDGGVKRGGDGSAGFDEEIEAEMNGAALGKRIGGVAEVRGGVKRASLVVTADADGGVRRAQQGLQLLREGGLAEVRGIGREKRAGDTEFEGEAIPFAQILWNERRGGRLILGEPVIQFGSVRDGGKTAGATESVAREARMNFDEAFECGPRGSFGDGDVGISRDERFAMRGVDDADGKTRGQKRKERGDFFFGEWMDTVIGGKNGAGSRERIVVAEDRVSRGDGGLSDGDGLVHVAKVDDGKDQAGLRPGK